MEIITTHINADFDCLGGMIAARKLYPQARLVFPGSQERSLRQFFLHSSSYAYGFARLRDIELATVTRLILVDVCQAERIGPFGEIARRPGVDIHIYDHHPGSPSDLRGSVEVIRPVGSTVTVFCELFRERGIHPDADEATMMMLGLYEDTGSLQFNSTTVADFHAAAFLLEHGAVLNTVADFLTQELTADQVALLHQLLQNHRLIKVNGISVAIAHASVEQHVGDIAVLAHKLKEMESFNALIIAVRMADRIFMVARSRIPEVHVGHILEEFHGGGHSFAAAATLRDRTLPQLLEELPEVLLRHVRPTILARDIMSTPVRSARLGTSLEQVRQLMTRYNVNALPVLDGPRVTGVVTRQLVDRAVHHGLQNQPVDDYLDKEVPQVAPETPLQELRELLIERQLRFLPVVGPEGLVGALTRTDLLRQLVADGEEGQGQVRDVSGLWLKKKRIGRFLNERLPDKYVSLLHAFGQTGSELGFEVFVVGGFVRDLLLREENFDIDIVVEGDGIRFAQHFALNHDCRVRAHAKFGTAVLIFADGFKVDVASARTEFYQHPAALPLVEHASIKLDLFRRDFTVNTLAVALNPERYGLLFDYFGGQRDLKDRSVRVLHNLSFVEDPTRVFRAVRFEQRLKFHIGKGTEQLLLSAVRNGFVDKVSGPRLFRELELILCEPEPWPAVVRLDQLGLLKRIHPSLDADERLGQAFLEAGRAISWYELLFADPPCQTWQVYLLCLTARLGDEVLPAFLQRLGLPPRLRQLLSVERVEARDVSARLHRSLRRSGRTRPSEASRLLRPFSTEMLLFMLALSGSEAFRRCLTQYVTQWRNETVSLDGDDLQELGLPPGPQYREILQAVLDARLDGKVASRREELALVRKRYGSQSRTSVRPLAPERRSD